MKRCPSCQAENLDDAVFCDNCGASLAAPAPTPAQPVIAPPPPAPAVQQPSQPALSSAPAAGAPAGIKCAACGTMNEAGSLFCENCGKSLTAQPAAPPPVPVPPPALAPPPPAPSVAAPAPVAPTPVAPPPAPPASAPAPVAPTPVAPPAVLVPVTPPQPAAPGASGMITATPATQPPPTGHPRFAVAASGMYFDLNARAELLIGRVDPISGIFPEIDLTAHGGDEGGVSRKHCKITLAGNQYFAEDLGSSNGTWVGTNRLQPDVRAPLNNGDQLRLGKVVLNFFTGV